MSAGKKPLCDRASAVRLGSAGYLLKMISMRMDKAMTAALAPLGVTEDQFKIIMTLTEFEGISQRAICQHAGLPSYAVTRNLDALGRLNLAERRPDSESRRSVRVYLTQEGKRLSPKLFQVVADVNAAVLGCLSPEQQAQLHGLLAQLYAGSGRASNNVG